MYKVPFIFSKHLSIKFEFTLDASFSLMKPPIILINKNLSIVYSYVAPNPPSNPIARSDHTKTSLQRTCSKVCTVLFWSQLILPHDILNVFQYSKLFNRDQNKHGSNFEKFIVNLFLSALNVCQGPFTLAIFAAISSAISNCPCKLLFTRRDHSKN